MAIAASAPCRKFTLHRCTNSLFTPKTNPFPKIDGQIQTLSDVKLSSVTAYRMHVAVAAPGFASAAGPLWFLASGQAEPPSPKPECAPRRHRSASPSPWCGPSSSSGPTFVGGLDGFQIPCSRFEELGEHGYRSRVQGFRNGLALLHRHIFRLMTCISLPASDGLSDLVRCLGFLHACSDWVVLEDPGQRTSRECRLLVKGSAQLATVCPECLLEN